MFLNLNASVISIPLNSSEKENFQGELHMNRIKNMFVLQVPLTSLFHRMATETTVGQALQRPLLAVNFKKVNI